MKTCPLCESFKSDDSFYNRIFKRLTPVCGNCWYFWRIAEAERAEIGLRNQPRQSRRLNDMPVASWQVTTTDRCAPRIAPKHLCVSERIREMVARHMPVNPIYTH
jgi:hypothetical protein